MGTYGGLEHSVPRHDADLAARLLPKLPRASVLLLRSAGWTGDASHAEVAAAADALHNLPAFLERGGPKRFDHHLFLRSSAADVLRGGAGGHLAAAMASRWRNLLSEAYGADAVAAAFPLPEHAAA